jgi:molybdenum-dependent DNA-binding transcriptional regulator ModE
VAQGQRLSDWQIETIRLAYAETGSISHAARESGCAYNTAKSYVASHHDDLTDLRNQKKADVVAQVAALRIRLLEEMHTATRLSKASLYELGTLFGILTDKHQLLTGKATSRTEQTNPLAVWSDDEIDALAAMAERRKAGELVS